MLKKINYVLEKRQKIHLCILLVIILGGRSEEHTSELLSSFWAGHLLSFWAFRE